MPDGAPGPGLRCSVLSQGPWFIFEFHGLQLRDLVHTSHLSKLLFSHLYTKAVNGSKTLLSSFCKLSVLLVSFCVLSHFPQFTDGMRRYEDVSVSLMLSGKKGAWRGGQGHVPRCMCALLREGCFLPACEWNNLFKMVRHWHGVSRDRSSSWAI